MNEIVRKNMPGIEKLCQKHKVKFLYLFGSAATPRFNRDSDIDFLISFEDVSLLDYADNYFDLQEELERLLHRKVDLVVEKSITNPYFKNMVEKTRARIYG